MLEITKKRLITGIIDFLNAENKLRRENLDVCFMVSGIDANIHRCKSFMEDITDKDFVINYYEEDNTGGYTYGNIQINVLKPNTEDSYGGYYNHYYKITFSHHYDGNDFYEPQFELVRCESYGRFNWSVTQDDYDQYEFDFKENEKYYKEEIKRKENERKKTILENQIKELQNQLSGLA